MVMNPNQLAHVNRPIMGVQVDVFKISSDQPGLESKCN